MDYIPLEIKDAIVNELKNKPDFLTCRLVCKWLKELATPRAFRVIELVPEDNTEELVLNLLARPDLSFHVKTIIYDDAEGKTIKNSITATISCFLHLSKFENLKHLRLEFPSDKFSRSDSSELSGYEALSDGPIQDAIFEALATSPPPKNLRCLEIMRILSLPHSSLHLPGFAKFLEPIQTLWLQVVCRSPELYTYDRHDLLARFWSIDIPVFLKSPTSLTSMTISSDRDMLYPSPATWDSISHPNLSTLRLRTICFHGPSNTGVEGLIVRHAASLKTLEITTCMIANFIYDPNPKTSAQVLHHFQAELKSLKDFTLFPTPGQMQDSRGFGVKYLASLVGGQGYQSLMDNNGSDPSTDVDAYENLQNTINSRRRLAQF